MDSVTVAFVPWCYTDYGLWVCKLRVWVNICLYYLFMVFACSMIRLLKAFVTLVYLMFADFLVCLSLCLLLCLCFGRYCLRIDL